MRILRKHVKRHLRRWGWEVRKLALGEIDDMERLVRLGMHENLVAYLDVGANVGQFATDLRVAGWKRAIVSFEPLVEAHGVLKVRAYPDPQWYVADRMAIGDSNETMEINVSDNSFSSSLLEIGRRHLSVAPESRVVKREKVDVRRLDSIPAVLELTEEGMIGLKMDTQGFELHVLRGLGSQLSRIGVIFTELNLVPLYDGAPQFQEMYDWFVTNGYRCVALSHELSDSSTGEMLQVNGTFARSGAI